MTSVLLPLPLTPVTATKHPSGKSTSMCCRLCSCASRTVSQASPGSRRISGTAIERLPERYWPVIDRLLGEHLLERALDDDLAAVLARARPDVDDVVGDADRLLVVLDDDHGVAEVAQARSWCR